MWPDHFPTDRCPPDDAQPASGFFYYLVLSNPPRPDSFLSALERGVFPSAPDCIRASLSGGRSSAYVEEVRSVVPRLRRSLISKVDLLPDYGRIKQTLKPGHYFVVAHGRSACLGSPAI